MKPIKRRRPQHPPIATLRAPAASEPVVASKDISSLPAVVATAFPRIRLAQRVRVLRRLLPPVGPLALAVVGDGAFAKFARQARWSRMSVSLQDAARITSAQVFELVRYVEQSNPAALRQAIVELTRDAASLAALGASFAAQLLGRLPEPEPHAAL
jgi:hypothetical protein